MNRSRVRKILLIFGGMLAIAGIFFLVFRLQAKIKQKKLPAVAATPIEETAVFRSSNAAGVATVKTAETPPAPVLPAKYLLDVQFQPQAPYGNWSETYENACEEAAIIIVLHYYNQQPLTKELMKNEIDAAVAWQITNWGTHADLNADQMLTLAQNYFKLSGQVVRNYQLEDLKKYISSGLPIIAPTAGRRLGNPNFRGAGPEYHNIVIIGFDDDQGIFITNDPGTRNGKSYIYKYQTVLSAISGPKENMEKAVVVLSKSN